MPPDGPGDEAKEKDASKVLLRDVLLAVGDTMTYEYDLGDRWLHTVELESVTSETSSVGGVELLDGTFACPAEDFRGGGTLSYEAALATATAVAAGDESAMRKLVRCRAAVAADATNYSPFFGAPELNCAGSANLYPLGFDVLAARARLTPEWRTMRAASSEAEQLYLKVAKMAKSLSSSSMKR